MPATPGVGDETISNFGVPTFYFGHEAYTSIGVVSNGYLVVGGGSSDDVQYLPVPFPNPAKPNNVLAPLWTDLNPAFGGAIRVATLGDGDNTWIVVDYDQVSNYSKDATHTYEVWIQTATGTAGSGPESEQITYSYGSGPTPGNAGAADPGVGVIVSGAENRDGSSGITLASAPADGSEYAVTTNPPTAGGSVTIPFDIWSKWAGTFKSTASLTSNVTPGITKVVQPITVTRH